jgi:hypothetical protein
VSIALATVTGNILATMTRTLLTRHVSRRSQPGAAAMRVALMMDPRIGKQALRRRAERIERLMNTARTLGGATASAAGSVYSGIRALIGM